RLDLGSDNISPIRSTIGVSKLVRFGGAPVAVPEGLVTIMQDRADPVTGLHRPDDELFREGGEVTILEGPFAGLNAVFKTDRGEDRSIVLLNLLGSVQQIHIDKEQLWPATCA
ncbi:MAG: transcription/translation regulatory transformer protein RfaH, partial [Pseudomonadota bacterium]|nr:transcription/translation regulatory transformer protein RfaH [Pseudomonadota bacterium]